MCRPALLLHDKPWWPSRSTRAPQTQVWAKTTGAPIHSEAAMPREVSSSKPIDASGNASKQAPEPNDWDASSRARSDGNFAAIDWQQRRSQDFWRSIAGPCGAITDVPTIFSHNCVADGMYGSSFVSRYDGMQKTVDKWRRASGWSQIGRRCQRNSTAYSQTTAPYWKWSLLPAIVGRISMLSILNNMCLRSLS